VLGKLRTDFVKNYKNIFMDITRALDTDNLETAHILTHTLKGLAGLINENDLAQTAGQLEGVLSDGKTPTSEQLSALEKELSRVFESIGKPETAFFPGYTSFDKDKAKMIFDDLYPLLQAQQVVGKDFLGELRVLPEVAVLVQQIEDFDFNQAIKTLDTLKKIFDM
jgi:HPt (histidine-containing phosphotransfer) domain-containing protein